MNDSLPPLSTDLEALLAAERDVPAPPTGAAERVFARVERTVSGAPGGGGATASATRATGFGRLALWGAVAAVVGAGAYLATRPEAPAPAPAPVAAVAAPAIPEAPAPPPAAPDEGGTLAVAAATHEAEKNPAGVCCGADTVVKAGAEPVVKTDVEPVVKADAEPVVKAGEGAGGSEDVGERPAPRPARDLAAERKLLEAARGALGKGDVGAATAALARHAREYPRGALTEEREVLLIHTLIRSGDRDAAETRLTTFRRRHPTSIHLPALEALLASGS